MEMIAVMSKLIIVAWSICLRGQYLDESLDLMTNHGFIAELDQWFRCGQSQRSESSAISAHKYQSLHYGFGSVRSAFSVSSRVTKVCVSVSECDESLFRSSTAQSPMIALTSH